jgi:predicted TIM-barrel fold metal-dependent hydrolase
LTAADSADERDVGGSQPDFTAGLPGLPDELVDALHHPLVDHHVHGCFTESLTRQQFEEAINEGSTDPVPGFMTQFDSQLGFAIRRWCAPLLGLPGPVSADDYWARRREWGDEKVARALLPAAGVDRWLVDTGYAADRLTSPTTLARWSGGRAQEIVRLESLGESFVAEGISPQRYADEFRARLSARGAEVVGVKSIVAYRSGFDLDWTAPTDTEVAVEVAAWSRQASGSGAPEKMTSPRLAVFGIHAAAQIGLPIQLHVGLGDRDLDLHRVDPMLLLPLLRQPPIQRVPLLLLHCYPFHRQAGYLAQAFGNVHFDVGLAINYLGARSDGLLAESLELAPFAKQLYSSDAFGPPELHLLGSVLWRRGMARVLGRWVREGDWSATDAARAVRMIGAGNAERIYGPGHDAQLD